MATATFERSLVVPCGSDVTWRILTDVSRVASWVSLVEDVREIEHLARYRAVLRDKIGPFRLRADLDICCTEVRSFESITLEASGEDRQMGSRIAVGATLTLGGASGGGTLVEVKGSYEVSGRVATLGAGTIHRKADKMVEQFFAAAEVALAGDPVPRLQ